MGHAEQEFAMIRQIRPLIALSLFATLAAKSDADATPIPPTTDVTRFAGNKVEGKIVSVDISGDHMPARNGQLEVINCIDLGTDDSGYRLWAVMVQKDDSSTNLANLATAAVDYLKQDGGDQFATGSIALIGAGKKEFIGAGWTTILVREANAEGVDYDTRDIGQVSVLVNSNGNVLAFDAKNPGQVAELNGAEIGRWMDAGKGSIIDGASKECTYSLESEHFKVLSNMDGTFLCRTKGDLIVISDGRNNAVYGFDGQKLAYKGFYEGNYQFALDDESGGVTYDEALRFTGDPDAVEGLQFERIGRGQLPVDAREALGLAA